MTDNHFDIIADEILKQQHIMEAMMAENNRLRQELADLRTGRGVFVEIQGKRFTFNMQAITPTPATPITTILQETPARTMQAPTTPISDRTNQQQAANIISPAAHIEQKTPKTTTFLEEIMLDEFENALTSPMSVTTAADQQATGINEDQKAALRRDLMGSFLLE